MNEELDKLDGSACETVNDIGKDRLASLRGTAKGMRSQMLLEATPVGA